MKEKEAKDTKRKERENIFKLACQRKRKRRKQKRNEEFIVNINKDTRAQRQRRGNRRKQRRNKGRRQAFSAFMTEKKKEAEVYC